MSTKYEILKKIIKVINSKKQFCLSTEDIDRYISVLDKFIAKNNTNYGE